MSLTAEPVQEDRANLNVANIDAWGQGLSSEESLEDTTDLKFVVIKSRYPKSLTVMQ